MKGALVGERKRDVIKMHGITIKIKKTKIKSYS
jgi:hypothetical protein